MIQWLKDILASLFGAQTQPDQPYFGGGGATVSFDEHPNIKAALSMVKMCEGTGGPDGYRTRFGGATFDSYEQHPRIGKPFKNLNGETQYSTAAGAYQFIWPTWDRVQRKLGLRDFSPPNQDAGAVELIRERGAYKLFCDGKFHSAVRKINREWASLPEAPYPQRTRTWDFAERAYRAAGGTISEA